MVINDKRKYFFRKTIQNNTKNRLITNNKGYAIPVYARGQNLAGEICEASKEQIKSNTNRIFTNSINFVGIETLRLLLFFLSAFFAMKFYYYLLLNLKRNSFSSSVKLLYPDFAILSRIPSILFWCFALRALYSSSVRGFELV